MQADREVARSSISRLLSSRRRFLVQRQPQPGTQEDEQKQPCTSRGLLPAGDTAA